MRVVRGALVWSASLDAVERALAGVVENPESFVVGAKLVRLNIEFQKQAVLRDALKLDYAAGCFGDGGEGGDRRPVFYWRVFSL
jgi:hypothetical protein